MISKKLPNREVNCEYCQSPMRFDSLSGHKSKSCVVNKLFGRTKNEIDAALQGVYSEQLIHLQTRINYLEEENKNLLETLNNIQKQNTELKQSNMELTNIVNLNYFEIIFINNICELQIGLLELRVLLLNNVESLYKIFIFLLQVVDASLKMN